MRKISQQNAKPKGEPYVWFTAMGLAVGLTMVLGLLGLILANGTSVFWPKRIAQINLTNNASEIGGTRTLTGIIVKEQNKDPRDLTPEERVSTDPDDRREMQLFVGNRDVFGMSFVYLQQRDIAEITYPVNIIHAKHLEQGDTIFFPIEIIAADGYIIRSADAAFDSHLERLVDDAAKHRRAIEHIERERLGRINARMRELDLEERFYRSSHAQAAPNTNLLAEIQTQRNELQKKHASISNDIDQLRASQDAWSLRYRLSSGAEGLTSLHNIIDFKYPNRLSLLGRVTVFFKNIWNFLCDYPREANTEGGIYPALFGTFAMTLLMSVFVMPFGVIAAVYLREYAKQGPLVRLTRIAINNLAGVPSIVFGVFGLGFFVYLVGGTIDEIFYQKELASNTPTFGTGGVLWASLTLALMTVPVVIVTTEEALAAVPRGVREGSLACGASKWQTIQRLVLPASTPGILTGFILAMARGAGEVAPLMLVGVVASAPNLPIDSVFPFLHLERKFMHLGFHIYDLGFQSPDSEAARPMVFATTLVLISLVVALNLIAIFIRQRLKKRYHAAAY